MDWVVEWKLQCWGWVVSLWVVGYWGPKVPHTIQDTHYCQCTWLQTRTGQWNSIAENIICSGSRIQKNQAMVELNASFLLTIIHSAVGHWAGSKRWIVIKGPAQLWTHILHYQHALQDVPSSVVVTWLLWVKPTFPTTPYTYSMEGAHVRYTNPGQRPVAKEVIGPSGEATAIVYDVPVKLLSKHLSINS
jgi:hypothetical protein